MRRLGLLLLALLLARPAVAEAPLPRLGADAAQVTVSGLSSGAFMAAQLHIAHAQGIAGAAIIAGGLYGCAVESLDSRGVLRSLAALAIGPCMSQPAGLRPAEAYADLARRLAAAGRIDPLAALAGARLYAFTGDADTVVRSETVRRAVALYQALGVKATNITLQDGALPGGHPGHGWITETAGGACPAEAPPYVNDCDFDLAGAVLQALYGPLEPKGRARDAGLIRFDQAEFGPGGKLRRHGLGEVGAIYLPEGCGAAAPGCRLHVALHGCRQSLEAVGEAFLRQNGLNDWAESNRIIVLYPQAAASSTRDFQPPRLTDAFNANPRGCWNWWGYGYDADYPTKEGVQVRALWGMVQRVTGREN
ncbi:PHB depolymerase family esterase [Siccirubricoccus sp. KC 17139]|uniref:PHB depolymerase family esterase n=1 Tax=Siccirubricoccus soli TaxID=2899147 RepID=A0ABT1D8Z9_9PROT|nr:PHB depolymerase family esterase [Siccirubricoccus soli]MCO6418067.1 PHB depolymerase family esterase [Siccirubricoccus soli]MCP2684202.1 PHB depolymerase family esterase [Siccirubricoccus soli]